MYTKKYLKKLISFNTISDRSNLELISYCEEIFESSGYKIKENAKGEKKSIFACYFIIFVIYDKYTRRYHRCFMNNYVDFPQNGQFLSHHLSFVT